MSYKNNRHRQPEDIWPENRALYYSDFQPDFYRKSDGLRVQTLADTDGNVLYHDGRKTSITTAARFYAVFTSR